LKKTVLVCALAAAALFCAENGNANANELNDLPTVNLPTQNTPEAWLSLARKYHEEATAALSAPEKHGGGASYQTLWKNDQAVQSAAIARMTSFGKKSINLCIAEAENQGSMLGMTNFVLSNLGEQAVEPILLALPDTRQQYLEDDLFDVLSRMDTSPCNALASYASTNGRYRKTALRLLARFKIDKNTAADERAACNRLGAVDNKYRDIFAGELHNEKDDTIRRNLIVVQQYFRPTSDKAIAEIALVLQSPASPQTRMAAIKVLGFMLTCATPVQRQTVSAQLARQVTTADQQSLKVAAINELARLNEKVALPIIQALQPCVDGNSNDLRQAALQTLSHFAVHNSACLKYLAQALKEDDGNTIGMAESALTELSAADRAIVEKEKSKRNHD